jgi:hypothetical protein
MAFILFGLLIFLLILTIPVGVSMLVSVLTCIGISGNIAFLQMVVLRNFAIDPTGRFLLIAHQNTDNIVIFAIDEKTGKLTRHKEYPSPTPVCLKIYPQSMRGA